MSKSRNIQPGHYRTYKESGKTIEVNGGPKYESSNVGYNFNRSTMSIAIVVVWLLMLPLCYCIDYNMEEKTFTAIINTITFISFIINLIFNK